MVLILMRSAKLAKLGLLKIKVFLNKGHNVIIITHSVTNKILSCNSNYTASVVTRPKFGNSSISIKKVFITFEMDLTRKINFFEGCSWFKFNNLRLALGMALKFYSSVANG